MDKAKDILDGKKQIIQGGLELAESGLIARTWGNLSARVDQESFLISPSGKGYDVTTPEDVVLMDIKTLTCDSDKRPSSEKKLHREIYRLKEDAGFIIHTHQQNASAVSSMGKSLIKLDRSYEGIGDFVLVAEYGLPGSTKVADKVGEAVRDSIGKAVIMSNHGAVCYGRDYSEAFTIARNLEEACGRYLSYMGIEPWDGDENHYQERWNTSSVIMKYMKHRAYLDAYLDDYAQMVGHTLEIVDYSQGKIEKAREENRPILVRDMGAMCNAECEEDSVALSMVIEKNCRAALAGIGCKPIGRYESKFMRRNYEKKYSKLIRAEGEEEGK